MRRPALSVSNRSTRGASPGSWLVRWVLVPLGSLYVASDLDVVWPLMVVEDEEVEKDWNVDDIVERSGFEVVR